ncbi:hypothetical protein [Burkholderia ambifaria]|jgi:hypothetical protein|uniref:Putative signal peptide protein n=1 Tax=Burkholderia ambifaria IOP40-10 TaxID=396596 RepID=B1F7L0_9BURK|nr:hypothetical protein [Burkholderia ambifaria]EDT06267.1 putative signal peptide protein [Burkholderia ambifaria IOP40-10]
MSASAGSPTSRALRKAALMASVLMACSLPCLGGTPADGADEAAKLRDAYQKLIPRLDHNQFKRLLYLDSEESSSTLKGEVYAVMAYPFATVNGAFNDPARGPSNWCDALILHPNIKYCRTTSGGGNTLIVNVSKKEVAEELSTTYRVQFEYDAATTGPGYLQVKLHADQGPLNTRDYRIALEAVALGGDRTFLHLTYAYSYGVLGRLAMKTYLAAFGRGKVGFTDIADPSAAQAEYIGGMRGLMERNTMRYYLAIDAYLGALSSPPDKRLEQRLTDWFDASERYPRQLHEMDRQQYMQMKYDEYRRQQTKQ